MTRTPKFTSRHLLTKILTCVAIAGTIAIAFHPLQMGLAKSRQENSRAASKNAEVPAEEDPELMQWWNEDIYAPAQPVTVPEKPPVKTGPQPSVFMEREEKDKPPVKHRFELPIPAPVETKPQATPKFAPSNTTQKAPQQPQQRPSAQPKQQQIPAQTVKPVAIPQPNSPQPQNSEPRNILPQNNKPVSIPQSQAKPTQSKPAFTQILPPAPANRPTEPAKPVQAIPSQPVSPKPTETSSPQQERQTVPQKPQSSKPAAEPLNSNSNTKPSKTEAINTRKHSPEPVKAQESKQSQPEKAQEKKSKREKARNKAKLEPKQPNANEIQKSTPATIQAVPTKEVSQPERLEQEKPKKQKPKKKKHPEKQAQPPVQSKPVDAKPDTVESAPVQAVPSQAKPLPEIQKQESKKSNKKRDKKKQEPAKQAAPSNNLPGTQVQGIEAKPATKQSESKPEPKSETNKPDAHAEQKRQKKYKKEKSSSKPTPNGKAIEAQPKTPGNQEVAPAQPSTRNQTPQNESARAKLDKQARPAKVKKEKKKPVTKIEKAKPIKLPETVKRPAIQGIPPIFQVNPVIPGVTQAASESSHPAQTDQSAETSKQQADSRNQQEKIQFKKEQKAKKQRSAKLAQPKHDPATQPLPTSGKITPQRLNSQNQTSVQIPVNKAELAQPKLVSASEKQPNLSRRQAKKEKKRKDRMKPGPEIVVFPKPLAVPATTATTESTKPVDELTSNKTELTHTTHTASPEKAKNPEKKSKNKKEKKRKVEKNHREKPQMAPQIMAFPTADAPVRTKQNKVDQNKRTKPTSQPAQDYPKTNDAKQAAQTVVASTPNIKPEETKPQTLNKAADISARRQANMQAEQRKRELRKEKERLKEEQRRKKAERKAQQKLARTTAKPAVDNPPKTQPTPSKQLIEAPKASVQPIESKASVQQPSQPKPDKQKKHKEKREKSRQINAKPKPEVQPLTPVSKPKENTLPSKNASNDQKSAHEVKKEERKQKPSKKKNRKTKKLEPVKAVTPVTPLKVTEPTQPVVTSVDAVRTETIQQPSKSERVKKEKKKSKQKKQTQNDTQPAKTPAPSKASIQSSERSSAPINTQKQEHKPVVTEAKHVKEDQKKHKPERVKKQKKSKEKKPPEADKQPIATPVKTSNLPQPSLAGSLPLASGKTQPAPTADIKTKNYEPSKKQPKSERAKKEKKKSKQKQEKPAVQVTPTSKNEKQTAPKTALPMPTAAPSANSVPNATLPGHAESVKNMAAPLQAKPAELLSNKKLKKKKSKKEQRTEKSATHSTQTTAPFAENKESQPTVTPAQEQDKKPQTFNVPLTDKTEAKPAEMPVQPVVSTIVPVTPQAEETIPSIPNSQAAQTNQPAETPPATTSSIESVPAPTVDTPSEKPTATQTEIHAPDSPQAKAAAYATAFNAWRQSSKPQRFDLILSKGQDAAAAILKSVDTMDESSFEALRAQMPGYLMLRNEIIVVAPDPAHFKDLMRKHGTPVDVAFFDLMAETLNGYWPTTMEQRSDLSGCTRFGSQDLVRLYGGWTSFQKRYPGAYRQALQDPNLPLLSDIEDQLLNSQAACDGPSSVVDELKSFILRYPHSELTPKLRKRLQDLERSQFDMVFYQGVKYNSDH